MRDLNEKWIREINLIGNEAFKKIQNTIFIIFGLGGVGGFAFESLVRAGGIKFVLIDYDKFDISNFNRQLEANNFTINNFKTLIYKNRATNINEKTDILTFEKKIINEKFSIKDNNEIYFDDIINNSKLYFNFTNFDNIYVLDMIDSIYSKISIMKFCSTHNIRIISSMGTANRINSSNIKIDNIHNTKNCPVAKKIRNMIKTYNIKNLNALFIDEVPIKRTIPPSTISYLPAICGLKISEFVIKEIITSLS